MKITSLERFILETIDNKLMTYELIKEETGLKENVCFNTLQALVIKNIVLTNGAVYYLNKNLSSDMIEKINHPRSKKEEAMELIEKTYEANPQDIITSKVALNNKDHVIFKAMLKNLESFLKECHQRSNKETLYKDRVFVFWGTAQTSQVIKGLVG